MMKEKGAAYVLWALSFFGLAGVHRIYLGRYVSGALYMLTWGFLGVGTIIDAFILPRMVDEENMLAAARRQGLIPGQAPLPSLPGAPAVESREKQILRTAAAHGGMVTPQLVALHTTLSLAEARDELTRLAQDGHCQLNVGEDGSEQYRFIGLTPSATVI